MIPNIFKSFRVKQGDPVSKKGLAEFIEASRKAWLSLDCLGGDVSWDNGRPIVIPPNSGGIPVDELSVDRTTGDQLEVKGHAGADVHTVPVKTADALDWRRIVDTVLPGGTINDSVIRDITAPSGSGYDGTAELSFTSRSHSVENNKETWDTLTPETDVVLPVTINFDQMMENYFWDWWCGWNEIGSEFLPADYECFKAFIESITDHGGLQGLGGDDHAQYLRLDGDEIRNAMSGVIGAADESPSIAPNARQLSGSTVAGIAAWNDDGFYVSAAGVYHHNSFAGITGDGFSGGIKVDAATAESSTIESVEMYT